jgi:zinc/manganese transport system ATP-binding protein
MLARSEVLAVRHLSVSLSGQSILEDIDFALESGEFCGLIGANGSGKTTLLRAILSFVAPSSGSVSIGGGGNLASVGYVPQKFVLDPYIPLRARDLVALGLDGNRRACRCRRWDAAERSTRCLKRWTRRGSPISGSATCLAASSNGC